MWVFIRNQAQHSGLDIDALLARALEPLEEPRTVRGLWLVLEEQGLVGTQALQEARRIYHSWNEPLRLFAGVQETLAQLAPVHRFGLISNAEAWYQHDKIAALGLAPYFPHVVLSGELGYQKPDSRIFRDALALIDVAPAEAVFVGDRLDVDIAGAQAVGMRAVWFNHWGGICGPGDPRPDAVIEHFAELPGVVAQLEEALRYMVTLGGGHGSPPGQSDGRRRAPPRYRGPA